MKSTLELRPVTTAWKTGSATGQPCWLAFPLLVRGIETTVADTWRNVRDQLERMDLVSLATTDGEVAERSLTTAGQRAILVLDLPEPPRYFAFTPAPDRTGRPLRGAAGHPGP